METYKAFYYCDKCKKQKTADKLTRSGRKMYCKRCGSEVRYLGIAFAGYANKKSQAQRARHN